MNQSSADLLVLAGEISEMSSEKKAWLLGFIATMSPSQWEAALEAYSSTHK